MLMAELHYGRCEHKYLVPEATAQALRGLAEAYLAPDPHTPAGAAEGYHVHSLYLDSRALELYQKSVDGIKNRFKLRMRFYNLAPMAPVFLEIKSRTTESIRKMRAKISRTSAQSMLSGRRLTVLDLMESSDNAALALEEFHRRLSRLSAQGSVFVSYQREAYVAPEPGGTRITFDRHIVGAPYDSFYGLEMPSMVAPVFDDQVVLELKYSGQLPHWVRELVRDFGLQRISFPKYVHAVEALQRQAIIVNTNSRGIACWNG